MDVGKKSNNCSANSFFIIPRLCHRLLQHVLYRWYQRPFWLRRATSPNIYLTLARSLTLLTFQVAEGFALPAAAASFSLRFTAPLLAAEHSRLLALRCGTACHRRLRRCLLWELSAFHSRRFCSPSHILTFGSS